MPEGYAYHRLPEGKSKVIYHCKKCGSRAEEVVNEGRGNKYTYAGLCRACFEIGVAASGADRAFDAAFSGLPSHEDFCSGKIKVLAYMRFENGVQNYLWSDKESDGEISESDLIEMGKNHGLKIERLAIFKLHRVFDRTEGGEGKDEGTGG